MLRGLGLQRDAFNDTDVSWEIYGNCLRQKDFQKAHNYLSMWIEEILESQAVVKFDEVVVRFLKNPTQAEAQDFENQQTPRNYRWFKNDWDRRIVVLATFAPVVLFVASPYRLHSFGPLYISCFSA